MAAQHALSAPLPEIAAPRRPRLRSLSAHVVLVANANASGITRRPGLVDGSAHLLRATGARVETRLTSSLEELEAILAHADRRIVLLGGDGSLHAAANAPGPKPELALLPAGRANNVARSLGVPTDLASAARLAVEGSVRRLDVIAARTATSRYLAIEGVSAGFHALARSGYHATNSADIRAALKTGIGTLARFRPLTVGLEIDGEFEVARIGQLFVANLPLFGPGLRVAPAADPTDGLLDLVLLESAGRARLLSLIPHLRAGSHIGRPGVRHIQARRIRIATGGRSPIIADTTNLGSGTVELTIEPAAIEVVGVPA